MFFYIGIHQCNIKLTIVYVCHRNNNMYYVNYIQDNITYITYNLLIYLLLREVKNVLSHIYIGHTVKNINCLYN